MLQTAPEGHYAAAMSFGGHLLAVHAKAHRGILFSMVRPEVKTTPEEARELAAALICAAEAAEGRDVPV